MHIPPYHKQAGWQRFFAGAFFGGLIAYGIFLFMHGVMQKDLLQEHMALQAKASELRRQNEALLRDNQDLDERSKEDIKIESIELEILNAEDMKLDRLLSHQLEELVKEEIDQIIGESVETIAESDNLLISTIENDTFYIDDFSYKIEVKKLSIYKTVRIAAEAKFAK